jgi:hypothetical protein
MRAWCFSKTSKKLRYDDYREIVIGVTHKVEGIPVPCAHGLHGSVKLLDALSYAPGPIIWEVELSGTIVEHRDGDKLAATERTYLRGGIDISPTLREFARWCALSVAHLWDVSNVVRCYLQTGDENLQDAAGAAGAAAWAAREAVGAADGASARSATWELQNTKLLEMVEAALKGGEETK